MHLLQRLTALVLILCVTNAVAIPVMHAENKRNAAPQTSATKMPKFSCHVHYRGFWDRYYVEGSNWNVTETQIRKAADGAGKETEWSFEWDPNRKDVQAFKVKFRLQIGCRKNMSHAVNKLLGINEKKKTLADGTPTDVFICPY